MWRSVLELLLNLNICGFQSGLTVFQLANNITLLGLATMPTAYNVADWVDNNQNLGAFRALQSLGFTMKTSGAVWCAFDTVYTHLEAHLLDEDKNDVGFSPIFVEHVLCKIVRWRGRLGQDSAGSSILATFAKKAIEDKNKGTCSFPFLLIIGLNNIKARIDMYNVSVLRNLAILLTESLWQTDLQWNAGQRASD